MRGVKLRRNYEFSLLRSPTFDLWARRKLDEFSFCILLKFVFIILKMS